MSRVPVCRKCLDAPAPFAAEHFCAACGMPFLNRAPLDSAGLCRLCRNGLSGFDSACAYGAYEGELRKLVHILKYRRVHPLADRLGALMTRALPRDREFDIIVPMPLHWRRRWIRGFNQSELLARSVGRRTGIPVVRAVVRQKATPAQAGLTAAQRRLNVAGAFRVCSPVGHKNVLLIDDVLTTGATAAACSAVLKRAGAERVTVLTLARADRRIMAPSAQTEEEGL